MTSTQPIGLGDAAYLTTFCGWLAEQDYPDAVTLGLAIAEGWGEGTLTLDRGGWVMLSNWLYAFAGDVAKDKVRRKAFDLITVVDAACAAMPRVVSPPTPDPVEPLGEVVGQGTLF